MVLELLSLAVATPVVETAKEETATKTEEVKPVAEKPAA